MEIQKGNIKFLTVFHQYNPFCTLSIANEVANHHRIYRSWCLYYQITVREMTEACENITF